MVLDSSYRFHRNQDEAAKVLVRCATRSSRPPNECRSLVGHDAKSDHNSVSNTEDLHKLMTYINLRFAQRLVTSKRLVIEHFDMQPGRRSTGSERESLIPVNT
jgi:hypothetical protein